MNIKVLIGIKEGRCRMVRSSGILYDVGAKNNASMVSSEVSSLTEFVSKEKWI